MTKNGSLELRVRVTKAFFPLFLLIATPQGRIRVFLAPSWLYVSVWELIDSYKHDIFLNFSLSVHCGIRKCSRMQAGVANNRRPPNRTKMDVLQC